MGDRERIDNNEVIVLKNIETNTEAEFFITDFLGSGSCVMTYRAYMADKNDHRIPGTLKEIYPYDDDRDKSKGYNVTRVHNNSNKRLNNQLKVGKTVTSQYFADIRERYADAVETVAEIMNDVSDMYETIPRPVVYKGIAKAGEMCSYYFWYPYEVESVAFNKVLDTINEDTANNKNKLSNLIFILKVIRNLASAVRIMHQHKGLINEEEVPAPIYHLDITPGNFGLKKESNKPTERIVLFDVNTITRDRIDPVLFAGTPGFRDPLFVSDPYTKSKYDIFSLGACLFYALVVNKADGKAVKNTYFLAPDKEVQGPAHKPDFGYLRERINYIPTAISRSLLFNGCLETENSDIQKKIADMLERCFSFYENQKYEDVNGFIKDINDIISTLDSWYCAKVSSSSSSKITSIVEREKEKVFDIGDAVCNLLCEYPLYDYDGGKNPRGFAVRSSGTEGAIAEPDSVKRVNILLCGGGLYAGTFIDTASQLMQLENYKAHFTVLSKSPDEDKERFLAKRPGIEDYFEIDGKRAVIAKDDPYAYINFREIHFNTQPSATVYQHRDTLESYLKEYPEDYGFVFCALHSDNINYSVARAAKKVFTEGKKVFSFVVFGDRTADGVPVLETDKADKDTSDGLVPVIVHGEYGQTPLHKQLDRMAFNTHLLWNGTLAGMREVKKAYDSDSYSKASSFASALAIQYRLKSLGISFDVNDLSETAAKVYEKLHQKGVVEKLAMYEHRRWNIEKIKDNYHAMPEDMYKQLTTENKLRVSDGNSEAVLYHSCILPSEAASGLAKEYWTKDDHKNWNAPSAEELNALDALDRMSVMLHLHFYSIKESLKRSDIQKELINLGTKISDNAELDNIYKVFSAAALELVSPQAAKSNENNGGTEGALCAAEHDGSFKKMKSSINSFKYYRNRLLRVFKEARSDKEYKAFAEAVSGISKMLYPVIEAYSFTDYKKKDEDIIRNIPFILTYSTDLILAEPLTEAEKTDPDSFFKNAAALLHINPEKVYYFLEFTEDTNSQTVNIQKKLRFIHALSDNHGISCKLRLYLFTTDRLRNECEAFADNIKDCLGENDGVDIIVYDGTSHNALTDYFSTHCTGINAIDLIENRGELFAGVLSARDDLPWFTFHTAKQEFDCRNTKAALVKYIPFKPSLYADDLFLVRGENSRYMEPQIKSGYEYIWENIYKPSDYDTKNSFAKKTEWDDFCEFVKSMSQKELIYISYDDYTDDFKVFEYKFPREYTGTIVKLTDAFKKEGLVQKAELDYESSYTARLEITATEKVNAEIEKLFKGDIILLSDPERVIVKRMDGISAVYDNLFVRDDGTAGKSFGAFMHIAQQLSDEKIICGKTDKSFLCTSPMVKKLLYDNEFIFRLYVYYKLIETGYFDEVRVDVKFDIGDASEDEIDIIAVKGFRTFIIFCKATNEQEKLKNANLNVSSFAKSNCINGKAILIADLMKDASTFLSKIAGIIEDKDVIGIYKKDELFNTGSAGSADVGASVVRRIKQI